MEQVGLQMLIINSHGIIGGSGTSNCNLVFGIPSPNTFTFEYNGISWHQTAALYTPILGGNQDGGSQSSQD